MEEWLSSPVELWPQFETFTRMPSFVSSVIVVDDAAERGVKLNAVYSNIITGNDSQKQCLLQTVEQHRRSYPNFKKSMLSD